MPRKVWTAGSCAGPAQEAAKAGVSVKEFFFQGGGGGGGGGKGGGGRRELSDSI